MIDIYSRKNTRYYKILRDILLIIVLLTSLLTGSCADKYSNEVVAMVTQMYHAIPKAQADLRGLRFEMMETDKYGRTLWSFDNTYIDGFLIVQKYDREYVYYYDNVSFQLGRDENKERKSEYFLSLKEANDWDKVIDVNKMISKELIDSSLTRNRKSALEQKTAEQAFRLTINDSDNIVSSACFFDYSLTGQELFCVERAQNISKSEEQDWEVLADYLMILNADGTFDKDNYIIEINDWDNINELLTEIKEKNDWVG